MNIQDKAVDNYLTNKGIKFSAALVGATKCDDWECDEWRVMFSRADRANLEQRYYMGVGHRKSKTLAPDYVRINPRSISASNWKKANLKPQAPTAAAVLYSLLNDARGADQNFDDWCSDYGYDTDSRKALKTYEACCATLNQVRKFFSTDEREQLCNLLEDY